MKKEISIAERAVQFTDEYLKACGNIIQEGMPVRFHGLQNKRDQEVGYDRFQMWTALF